MTLPPLVLDNAGLDGLSNWRTSVALRDLLHEAAARDRPVLIPAVVCAEACRGAARTRQVEVALARYRTRTATLPAVEVVDTDFELARQVGMVLNAAKAGTEDIVDAHVVSVCIDFGGGVVVTSDPDDIHRLAAAVPSIRIVTRPPR